MNKLQDKVLRIRQTDLDGAIRRFSGNEQLYEQCLREFLQDTTMQELNESLKNSLWDEAFTAAHAIKGVAGNMGFFPLMHQSGQLLVMIRGGRTSEIPESLNEVNSAYRDIVDGIHQYFAFADKN